MKNGPTAQPSRFGSLGSLTDLYELTMACAYWKSGTASDFDVLIGRPP